MGFRATVVFTLLLLTVACQTASLQTARDHLPQNGILALRHTLNGATGIRTYNPWARVEVVNAKGETFGLSAASDGLSRSALYVGSLPPGEYKILEFLARTGAVSGQPSEKLGGFRVEAGRVTYLGTMVEHVVEGRFVLPVSDTSNYLFYDPKPDSDGLPEVLGALFPGLVGVDINPNGYIGWGTGGADARAIRKLYASMRSASRGLINPVEMSDGSIAFGTLLGQLRLWHADKGWRQIDVGLNRSVEAFAELPNGRWLVGGEMGMLRQSSTQGAVWQDVDSSIPYGVIADINVVDNSIYVTHFRGTTFTLYRSDGGLGRWDAVQSSTFAAPGRLYGFTPQRLKSHRHQRKIYTTLPNAKLAVYDTATGLGTIVDLPGAFGEIRVSRDGVLRGSFEQFIVWNPLRSADGGKTWEAATISRSAFMPAFKDATNGINIEFALGGKQDITMTTDGGRTWTTVGNAPSGFTPHIEYAEKTGVIYITDRIGFLYVSRDGGKSWIPDFFPFEPANEQRQSAELGG